MKRIKDVPKWKLVGATAAVAGLGVGGVLGATVGASGNDDPVKGIPLEERIAVRSENRPSTTTTQAPKPQEQQRDSVSSPLDRQSVASVRSVRSPASPASAASPAPAARPAPRAAARPTPAPAPAPRGVSYDSPPSAPAVASAPSANSPASVDSP